MALKLLYETTNDHALLVQLKELSLKLKHSLVTKAIKAAIVLMGRALFLFVVSFCCIRYIAHLAFSRENPLPALDQYLLRLYHLPGETLIIKEMRGLRCLS
jgi:hypothetical protein